MFGIEAGFTVFYVVTAVVTVCLEPANVLIYADCVIVRCPTTNRCLDSQCLLSSAAQPARAHHFTTHQTPNGGAEIQR